MLRSYFKIAIRNLVKNKAHTFINIAGLSVGLACSILILLWVQNELSIDAWHANGDRLYKVYEREYYDGKIDGNYDTPAILGDEIKRVIPDVEYAINMDDETDSHTFSANKKIIKIDGTFAGADLFKMFSYPLIEGKPATALASPLSMAISENMAKMFFGSAQAAMGKTLRFEDKKDLIISGVFKDLPENSSVKFDYVINWQYYLELHPGGKRWDNSGPLTYVMLRKGANVQAVNNKLRHFMSHYKVENTTYRSENELQKYSDVYLNSHFVNGQFEGGRIEYVHLFSIIAVFILLIACVNFMNLTTAQSAGRAREIGVRKVMGAVRGVLIKQFIGESLILTTLAVVVSLLLISAVLPLFNQITQKQITIPFADGGFWLKLSALTLITGLVSGSYPALFLSSFNPVSVLKGTLKFSDGAVWFRKGLVVFQFVLSSVLIIATVVVSRQVNYIQNKNIGYDRDNLVYVHVDGELKTHFHLFKTAALNIPGVSAVSYISNTPTFINNATTSVQWEGKDQTTAYSFFTAAIGHDFVKTMKLKIAAGRDYSYDFPADSHNYIINEAAARKFGFKDPVGNHINMWGGEGTIVGVIKDFHFRSLHESVEPLICYMSMGDLRGGDILVRIEGARTKEVIGGLQALCRQINPKFPFSYHFSDEQYQKLYKSEQIIGNLSDVFAFLAIFISCLGLLGLAMFTARQRVREIGIRKVLGASVASLFALLSSEFLLLVCISMLIASPIAWYAMSNWLRGYAYHADMPVWIFAATALITILITLLTVSFHALKAALVNPVKSLKTE
ncbi:MAG TPA: ABC transporter permease [Mucilaginibacter sp.]|nr:ABC transporter permease [Mucilaginibacter sp.]